MADLSPASGVHEICRPGLLVTSHITDPMSGTWGAFLIIHDRGRGHFHFTLSKMVDKVEMAPAPFMEHQALSLYYLGLCGSQMIKLLYNQQSHQS